MIIGIIGSGGREHAICAKILESKNFIIFVADLKVRPSDFSKRVFLPYCMAKSAMLIISQKCYNYF